MIPLVEVSWILKALAVVVLVALLCAYITMCVLFSHGQWQLVLHPSRTVAATPASLNLPFTEVHFGVDETGIPQLTGWWIPADSSATGTTNNTALILHAADALTFLTTTRSIPATSIVIYGTGLGASLAVHLCAQNPTLPTLILQSPDGDLTDRAAHDPRSKIVPFKFLFNQTFPLASPLQTLPTPKLLLPTPPNQAALALFLSTHLKP